MSEAETNWLREWFKPLGLVRRADQLVRAAKFTVEQYGGSVPQTLEQLSNFPGIGRYSARAIQCLAYGAPVPKAGKGRRPYPIDEIQWSSLTQDV